jgi:hypothetical protein
VSASRTNRLERYDELVALTVADIERRQAVFVAQGRVILALDGLQPDGGHEVLGVLREVLSGEGLLARSLLSASAADRTVLLQEATAALPVPVVGMGSRGQHAIRNAVSCGAAGRGTSALPVPIPARGGETGL